MKLIITSLTVVAAMALSIAFANASHAPGSRSWRAIITGDETADASCKQFSRDGTCTKK
jgi:hypothetical protein